MTEFFIAIVYVGTLLGICVFLAFVCRLGDLGFWVLGWIDNKIQERQPKKIRVEDFPWAYGPPGVSKSSTISPEK
jgi:hypothetical protein